MKSFIVPDGTLLLDTNSKIFPHVIPSLLAFRDSAGRKIGGIIRYVSLYQVNTRGDIDPIEAQLIIDNFECLGLVQHCLAPPPGKKVWTAVASLGVLKGQTAKKHADLVGYPSDSMLSYDNEDCEGDVAGEIDAWIAQIARPSLLYTGFCPGLTEQQLYERNADAYWGAAGAWDVATSGVAMRQHYPEITIGGVSFDWNLATADKLGRRIVLATAGDPDPGLPAAGSGPDQPNIDPFST